MGPKPQDPWERFRTKYTVDVSGCWLWTAAQFVNGYGAFRSGPRQVRAHRWSYEHFHGPIPDGLRVCHSCDVRHCVNPNHLWLGDDAANHADRDAKGRGAVGDRNGARLCASKIDSAKAAEIRAKYATSGMRQVDLGAMYGISQTMVGMIVRGERWAA